MKLAKLASIFGLVAVMAFATTGCKHKKPDVTKLPKTESSNNGLIGNGNPLDNGSAFNSDGTMKTGGGDLPTFDPDSMDQDRTKFAADTVYFDYDSSTIKGSEQSKLDAVASELKADASAKLLIEGNCDERGTEEYNRSLGERRALAAREALASAGVEASRVATRSYGEDRPADHGHDQGAWAKNRRDEFVLLHPK